ncbi:exopolygalacturonase-like [Ricinus communis]|uniref:exopolygalacturonase-like n=1 Tax=Ricinus communis TaxID=3988 RepID=UPI00201B2C80|nr:exopolygalacturonase-like [Ricinus communis]
MKSKLSILTIFVLLSISLKIRAEKVFDVKNFGATPSQKNDISKALLAAWKAACSTPGASRILIPHAKYALRDVLLEGPCKGSMVLQIKGTLMAPADPSEHHSQGWITFQHVDHLTISGGNLDGRGKIAWGKNTCRTNVNCKNLPMNLRFDFVTNTIVEDLTSRDSKNFHMNLIGCQNFTLQRIKIIAPGDSANTDGIHIGRSNGVNIIDSKIGTGDDCISIGDGSRNIKITGVRCGPGHGISIGSLGKYKNEEPVSGVYVKKCDLINTTNGIRIKSWPGLFSGTATDLHFEDISMNNVSNAILIDQMYCPWNHCNSKASSNVKISKVTFSNIKGTSSTPTIVKLLCSKGLPCEGVELNNINVVYKGPEGPAKSECTNVKPKIGIRTDMLRGC